MTTSCWLLVGTDNGQAHISCFDSYKIDRLTDSLTLSYTFSMAQDKQVEVYRMALKEARSAFDRAHSRVNEMAMETARLNRNMGKLRRTITALAAMCSEVPWADPLGITDSCMEVMEEMPFEMATTDVVKALEDMGFDLTSQKNAAASVHAVLSRLAEKEKIQKVLADDSKTVKWRGPKYDPKLNTGISDDDIPF